MMKNLFISIVCGVVDVFSIYKAITLNPELVSSGYISSIFIFLMIICTGWFLHLIGKYTNIIDRLIMTISFDNYDDFDDLM